MLGRLVEEIIIYLLTVYFEKNNLDYLVSNDKQQQIVKTLRLEKKNSNNLVKYFDADVLIYKKSISQHSLRKVFCLSVKGTTRERIGQFLSHLFLMDQDVLDAKYGKDRYEVIFHKENVRVKYAFVTLDWAQNKDFIKHTSRGKERTTMKKTEVRLILDDHKLGGGIYVLNNYENIDGTGNFAGLCGRIVDFLK